MAWDAHGLPPPMRALLFSVAFSLAACVDAPITPDQLQADGTLRPMGHEQAAFSAAERQRVQQAVQVSAVLAAQADGPLEDGNEFDADVGTIHLHVRADGLVQARAVVYRWRHEELTVLEPGALSPTGSLSLGTSFDIDPELYGRWEVDVLTQPDTSGERPRVLFHREFEVKRPSD
jgi:hypothetical protein